MPTQKTPRLAYTESDVFDVNELSNCTPTCAVLKNGHRIELDPSSLAELLYLWQDVLTGQITITLDAETGCFTTLTVAVPEAP
jgi:hypothetical protein